MSEHNSEASRRQPAPALPPGISFEAVTNAMRVADALGFITIEATTCPHCQHRNIYAHVFNEHLTCMACQKPFPSKIPRPPQPGEVTAAHMEAAMVALHRAARKEQVELPAIGAEEWATYPELVQRAMKRYALSEVLKSLERTKELGMSFAEL